MDLSLCSPCSPGTIPSKQEDKMDRDSVFSYLKWDQQRGSLFSRHVFQILTKVKKKTVTLIAQRDCSPFPFLLIPELPRSWYLRCLIRGLPQPQGKEGMLRAEVRTTLTPHGGCWSGNSRKSHTSSSPRESLRNNSFSFPKVQYRLSLPTSDSISSAAW